MIESVIINEITEITANNLTDTEKKIKLEQLKNSEKQIMEGIADPQSIIHEMVFTSEKAFFKRWAAILKQKYYLGEYKKPVNTICAHIKKQIEAMRLSSDFASDFEKKENLYRNVERSLDAEFKVERSDRQIVGENTSGFQQLEDSFLYRAVSIVSTYFTTMLDINEKFKKHLEDPDIRKDFENTIYWEELALFCSTLEELTTPIKEHAKNFEKLDEQLAEHTPLKSIEENFNLRQSVDTFRNCLRLLNIIPGSYRNWAHKFGISARQHQRNRKRDEDWPEKSSLKVIQSVIGSTACPNCKVDLITKEKYFNTPPAEIFTEYKFRDKKFKIPEDIRAKNLTPIKIAELVFGKKLKLIPIIEK